MRHGWQVVLRTTVVAATVLLIQAGSASAMVGPHTNQISPAMPRVGEAVTLTAVLDPNGVVGTPEVSWDLDGDGTCETPWSTDLSTTTTFTTVGQHSITSCTRDASGEGFHCGGVVAVFPAAGLPTWDVKPQYVDLTQALHYGLRVRVRWAGQAPPAYLATLTLVTAGDGSTGDTPLSTSVGTDGTVSVQPTPNWRALLAQHRVANAQAQKSDNGFQPDIRFSPDFSADPSYGPVAADLDQALGTYIYLTDDPHSTGGDPDCAPDEAAASRSLAAWKAARRASKGAHGRAARARARHRVRVADHRLASARRALAACRVAPGSPAQVG